MNTVINATLNPLVGILRRFGLLAEDIDYHVIRASMVIIFPPHRECRQYWQPCELILAQADIMEVNRQLELALFCDATLDLVALYAEA
jgi:hypothetical protein